MVQRITYGNIVLTHLKFAMATASCISFLKYAVLVLVLPKFKVEGRQNLINLNEDNWRDMLKGEWMVEFYAPWCPACKSLQPVWNDFSNLNKELKINVGQVDVTTSPGLSGRFMVTALPTIFHIIEGEFRQYKGGRDKNALILFIKDKKWAEIEPIPSWQSPSSFLRYIVSLFYKLSTVLRSVHNYLLEEYGLPAWSCYLILAVATILLGAIFGLILVLIIDQVNPSKPCALKSKTTELKYTEELDEVDDILDENSDNKQESSPENDDVRQNSENDNNDKNSTDKDEYDGDEKQDETTEQSKNVRKRKSRKAM